MIHDVAALIGRTRLGLVVAVLAVLGWSRTAAAIEPNVERHALTPAGSNEVDPFAGAFNHTTRLTVPAYRGLEPRLALAYSSARGPGTVGLGWSLAGVSFIERRGPRKAVAQFDATDVFWLEGLDSAGLELMPCAALDGTHCTKQQRFLRIRYDAVANAWVVWEKNGTRRTFKSRQSTAAGTFRWYLTSVEDANANRVTYTYWSDSGRHLYLDAVTYNGTEVKLYWEARPDIWDRAMGGAMGAVGYRLKSVDVKVAGSRVRAYALSYALAKSSGSVLSSLRQCGRDCSVSSSGVVTGGTWMPAQTFSYDEGGTRFQAAVAWDAPFGAMQINRGTYEGSPDRECIGFEGCSGDAISGGDQRYAGLLDLDGDGRPDYILSGRVYLNDGQRFVESPAWGNIGVIQERTTYWSRGSSMMMSSELTSDLIDIDGDGLPDRIVAVPSLGTWSVSLNTGSGFASPKSWAAPGPLQATMTIGEGGSALAAPLTELKDMDGDGLRDYIMLPPTGTDGVTVRLNTGTGFTGPRAWPISPGVRIDVQWSLLGGLAPRIDDLNGDGLADLVIPGAPGQWWVALNNGEGFAAFTTWSVPGWAHTYSGLFGIVADWAGIRSGDLEDMNGDGRPDLVFGTDGQATQVWLNTGRGFTSAIDWGGRRSFVAFAYVENMEFPCDEWGTIICSRSSSSTLMTALIDLDGDGLVDRVTAAPGGWTIERNNGATVAGLMTAARSELGGGLQVAYSASSAFAPTKLPNVLPVVSSMTATDGRGGSVSVRYEYAGGLWSAVEGRFLGFRRAKVFDATGAYKDHLFTQNVADPNSTRQALWVREPDGRIVSYETFTYARAGNGTTTPYRSLLAEKWAYECNGNASCKRSLTAYSYNAYGDPVLTIEHGDADVAGDERTLKRIFAPNAADYLVSFPAQTVLYEGAGTDGVPLQHHRIGYDGQAIGVAPIRGNVTRREERLFEEARFIATTMTYDTFGNRRTETDPLGNTTTTAWDPTFHLYPTSVTNALGQITRTEWDGVCAVPNQTTDANGRVTTTQYDPLCRPLRETRPDGSYTTLAYQAIGDPQRQRVVLSISDGLAGSELWHVGYFDGLGRVYQTVGEGDRIVDIRYDARGLETRRSVPHATGEAVQWVTKELDAARRLTRTIHPDATFAEVQYLDWGTRTVDELGKPIQHLHDAYGQLSETTEWNAGTAYVTRSRYDLLGRLVRITDANGNVTTRDFDSLGRRLLVRDPDLGTWRYAYDDAGNLTSQTDAKAQARTFTYDALHRLRKKLQGTTTLATFRYDEARAGFSNVGRLTTMLDASGSTVRDYDSLGRLARETKTIDGDSFTFTHGYDPAGRPASLVYPDGEVVSYRYNAAGDLIAAGRYATAATYNARGKIVSRTLGNGLGETFSYDPRRHWLTRMEVRDPAGVLVDEESYAWDVRGEIVAKASRKNPKDNWEYRYDDLRRLTRAVNLADTELTQAFSYDAIGNIIAQTGVGTYAYPASGEARPHAPLSAGTQSFAYDRNGNRVSDGTRRFDYDIENKLVAVDGVAYVYDGEGTRVRAGNTIEVNKYVEKTGDCVRKYYYFADLRVARRDCTRDVFYYHAGYDRSTRKLTDAAGAEVRRHVLTPFGQITNALGIADPFGLAGERVDASGLYHMGARYLDPVLGQFTQPDPSADPDPAKPQTLNRYAYAYNNPIRISDPSGYDGDGGGGDDGSDGGNDGGGEGGADDGADASAANDSADEGDSPGISAADEGVSAQDNGLSTTDQDTTTTAVDEAVDNVQEVDALDVVDMVDMVHDVVVEVIDAKVTVLDALPTVPDVLEQWGHPPPDPMPPGYDVDHGIMAPPSLDRDVDPRDVKDGKVPGVTDPDVFSSKSMSEMESEMNHGYTTQGWDI